MFLFFFPSFSLLFFLCFLPFFLSFLLLFFSLFFPPFSLLFCLFFIFHVAGRRVSYASAVSRACRSPNQRPARHRAVPQFKARPDETRLLLSHFHLFDQTRQGPPRVALLACPRSELLSRIDYDDVVAMQRYIDAHSDGNSNNQINKPADSGCKTTMQGMMQTLMRRKWKQGFQISQVPRRGRNRKK